MLLPKSLLKDLEKKKLKSTMALFLFLLALPLLLFFLLQKHTNNGCKTHLPPGPPNLPFIGNLHQLDASAPQIHLWQLSRKYGPLMSMKLGCRPTLVVSSARSAKQVLKTHDLSFCSRPNLQGLQKLSYNCLDVAVSPYNEYWREMRKICVLHLFSSKRVQSFRPVREEEVSRMTAKVSELSSSSKTVNLSEVLMSLTSTIICRVAFGKRYEEEGCERSRFHGLLNEAQAAMGSFYIYDYFPIVGRWIDKLTGLRDRLDESFEEMDLFLQEVIDEHLDPNRPQSMENDIIDLFLQLKRDQLSSFDLTFDHIKAVVMDILVGGTDTSAATVVWAMTWLIKNPRVMKKVQEEIRNSIGKKSTINEEDLENLQYFKAVIKETMRLSPPVPLLMPRESIQSCALDGYEIPPKTLVYVNAYAIGRDPECWENPEEFYPERFVGSEIDYKGNDFELIPFGAGRRGCPGMVLGALTVELSLGNLLYWFDWALPVGMTEDDVDIDASPGITMHKRNHLCLVAKNHEW